MEPYRLSLVYDSVDSDVGTRIETLVKAKGWTLTPSSDSLLDAVILILSPAAKQNRGIDEMTSRLGSLEAPLPIFGLLVASEARGSVPYEIAEIAEDERLIKLYDAPERELQRFWDALAVKVDAYRIKRGNVVSTDPLKPDDLNADAEFWSAPAANRRTVSIVHDRADARLANRLLRYLRGEGIRATQTDYASFNTAAIKPSLCIIPILSAATDTTPDTVTTAIQNAASQKVRLFPLKLLDEQFSEVKIPSGLKSVQLVSVIRSLNTGMSGDQLSERELFRTMAVSIFQYRDGIDVNDTFVPVQPFNPVDQLRLTIWQMVAPRRLFGYYLGRIEGVRRLRRVLWWSACTFAVLPWMLSLTAVHIGILHQNNMIRDTTTETLNALTGVFAIWLFAGLFGAFLWPLRWYPISQRDDDHLAQKARLRKTLLIFENIGHDIGGVLAGVSCAVSLNLLTVLLPSLAQITSTLNTRMSALPIFLFAALSVGTFVTLSFISMMKAFGRYHPIIWLSLLAMVLGVLLIPVSTGRLNADYALISLMTGCGAFLTSLVVSSQLKLKQVTVFGCLMIVAFMMSFFYLLWSPWL